MQKIWKSVKYLSIIALLTLFTQTGGLIFLACLPIFISINKKIGRSWKGFFLKIMAFSALYFLINIGLVPPLAKWESGRVPLPIFGNDFPQAASGVLFRCTQPPLRTPGGQGKL
ncbi:MAG: hypothetical protein IPN76_15520 [Saprospiraceae bacterium]|nr:hypothetical protein [Saprospiraceae bacterium]